MTVIDEYMQKDYTFVVVPDHAKGVWNGYFPDLRCYDEASGKWSAQNGCSVSANTWQDLYGAAEKAKHDWISNALKNHVEIPEPGEGMGTGFPAGAEIW